MSKLWCKDILKQKLTEKEIKNKIQEWDLFARRDFPANGCFNMEWIADVLRKIDELWYDGQLLPGIVKAYGGIHLYVDDQREQVAAYVLDGGDKISLHMNRDLFATLFKNDENGYHSGGLLCKDRLTCLRNVLLHETVHLVLTLCDKTGFRQDVRDHGKEFNRIVKHLFGQTDPQHGLIPGHEQFHDLNTIRSSIQTGSSVEVQVDGHWIPCKVLHKGRKWVKVSANDKDVFSVHAGLIRLIDPTRLP